MRGRERLLERLRPRVDPVQDRDLLQRHRLLVVEPPDRRHDRVDLGPLVGAAVTTGVGPDGRVARSVFRNPPIDVASLFATSSTSGVER